MTIFNVKTTFAIIAPSIFIVLVIWIPFGFDLTGLIEEWDILGLFASKGLFFWANTASPLAVHSLRPLTIFPHAVAYYIDPDSFNYWHVLLMISLVMKGTSASYLGLKITRSLGLGLFLGALVLVYPADTMQLSFRALHINLSLGLLLLSSSLYLSAFSCKRLHLSYFFAVSGAGLFLISVLMYEAALPLVIMPFIIIYAKDGFKEFWYSTLSRPHIVIIWFLACILYIALVINIINDGGGNYQSSLLSGKGSSINLYDTFLKLFTIGMLRGLLGGWFDAFGILRAEYGSYIHIAIATIFCIGIIFFLDKKFSLHHTLRPWNAHCSQRVIARMSVSGIFLFILGYFPYLFSGAHLAISQRTFLFSTPGAALALLAFFLVIIKLFKKFFILIASGLFFLGLSSQWFQFDHYHQLAEKQRLLLRSIIENFDGNVKDKTLMILDESKLLNHTWMLQHNIHLALSYLYDNPINSVEICLMPGGEWQKLDGIARTGTCIEGLSEWIFKAPTAVTGPNHIASAVPPDKVIQKEKIVFLTINPDGSITQDQLLNSYRINLKSGNDSVSRRYQKILAADSWPINFNIFNSRKINNWYRWDFGKWWSLELPIRGSGWREAEWQINRFYHNASAWKTKEQSTLLFDIAPTDETYVAKGQFTNIINQAIKDSFQVFLNGRELNYRWYGENRFEATVPAGLLSSKSNTIEFNSSTVSDYYGLSMQLDWFDVRPL